MKLRIAKNGAVLVSVGRRGVIETACGAKMEK